ncbi:hypothetical protein [Pedobacter immunditicola]|uniref:hypothetical protein n=1 Tax=Pedobacter immunditicola TaxID=3133440 RepID=UPI003096CCF0
MVNGQWIKNEQPGIAYMRFPVFYRTAAGIMSTAKEMANWIIALQNGQLLQQKSSIATLWDPAILNNGKIGGFNQLTNGYALGWPTVYQGRASRCSTGGWRQVCFVCLHER